MNSRISQAADRVEPGSVMIMQCALPDGLWNVTIGSAASDDPIPKPSAPSAPVTRVTVHANEATKVLAFHILAELHVSGR